MTHAPEMEGNPAVEGWRLARADLPVIARGVALLALAVLAVGGWLRASRWSAVVGGVTAPVLLPAAFLALWAAAIHLTGGEKFDDHPWV
jgi:hypothetical protein